LIHGTSMLRKHNPRWPIGSATDTIQPPDVGPPTLRGDSGTVTLALAGADALRGAAFRAVAWLKGLPRRAGRHLFARNDEEARWWGWQVTEFASGLARQYRDQRFDALRHEVAHASQPGAQPWLGGYIPGVPEAWDDHWDGVGPADGDR
jgi:hypothetical protein